MYTVPLDLSVLGLLNKFFSDIKSGVQVSTDAQKQLHNIIGSLPLKVILADDDDDDFDFFAEAMHSIMPHASITRACDGIELIEKLEKTADLLPDLIFLDLNMPCKNGFECLEAIKKSPKWKNIPVLIYSTSAHIDQVDITYKNGANLYIQKPHDFKDIKSLINKLFSLTLEELAFQPLREKYLFKLG